MKKIIRLLLLCFLICLDVNSQTVSKEMALQVAENFWRVNSSENIREPILVQPWGESVQPTMYVCSLSDRWVLIAGDKRAQPILAYSEGKKSTFPSEDEMPPAMLYLINGYNEHIETLRFDNTARTEHPDWAIYAGSKSQSLPNRSVIVSPLLTRNGNENIWGQDGNNSANPDTAKVYNKFCPSNNGCAHSVAGCGAVALGQILWYWQWPYAKKRNFLPNHNRLVSIYNWDIMPYQLTNESSLDEANMIATLLHDIGEAENMSYGCSVSSSDLQDILNALRNTFYYNADEYKERSDYADSTWYRFIKSNLDERHPVFYRGRTPFGYHFWVIDGYDSNNCFHMNFGWHGDANNYYSLPADANNSHAMITNITPNYEFYCSPFTVPWSDQWPTNFTIRHGGGITLYQIVIESGMHGYIFSEDYVKIDIGTYIEQGAEVYIGIQGSRCNDELDQVQPSRMTQNILSAANHFETPNLPRSSKELRDGQLFIIHDTREYNANGVRVK